MIEVPGAEHLILHRDENSYCAHAQAAVAADGTWLVIFNRAPRRKFTMHPPEEPLFRNVIIRSEDRGRTWSAPQVAPDYQMSGTECASLTALSNGQILLNQWQFQWYPLDLARTLPDQAALSYPSQFLKGWLHSPEHEVGHLAGKNPEELAPWVRGGGKTVTHLSNDHGKSFVNRVNIDTQPFSGGYGMRGCAELADGTLLLPLSDVPHYKSVFAVRSHDGGRSWSAASAIASAEGHEFEEPTIAQCKSGKIVIVLRDNVTRWLHQVESLDGGTIWTSPRRLPVAGYPAHLITLADGRLLMTYGWRSPDYGIRAVVSSDEGESWAVEETLSIRDGMLNRNLGYPVTLSSNSSEFFTAYYGEDSTGCTCIMGTRWRLPS